MKASLNLAATFVAALALAGAAHAATPTATTTTTTTTTTATGANTGSATGTTGTTMAMGHDAIKMIHANELANWMTTQKTTLFIFDANNPETRAKEGVIPGAKLLDSSSRYNTAMLPADKTANIVFYCANTACTASHAAAKRAIDAGYKNVSVMADGITGWKKAGKATMPAAQANG